MSATTKGGGHYSIKRLAPGGYVVGVRPPEGFFEPRTLSVKVSASRDVPHVDFSLLPRAVMVTGPTGLPPPLTVTGPSGPPPSVITGPPAATGILPLPPVTVAPTPPPPGATPAALGAGDSGTTEVDEFQRTLLSDDLNIEGPIDEDKALEAIALFAVSSVLLAGLGLRRVGSRDKVDVLGMLTLYYGLQDKSLSTRVVLNSRYLWGTAITVIENDQEKKRTIGDELKSLRDSLDTLGEDVVFLSREARRQFNLGTINSVTGNVGFPRLFKRYVDIAGDALLTLDLREEDKPGRFTSKEKIGQAYDLLAELKGIVLQIVRSLSRYGTIAIRRSNRDWALFENRAFAVLKSTGEHRITDDLDERRVLSVLADLLDESFETVISPYFALARNGTALLSLAFETYLRARSDLEDFDRDHLLTLFQRQGPREVYLTTRLRSHALVLKRHPLQAWN